MIWQWTPFTPVLALTAAAALVLGAFVWRRRPASGTGPAAVSFFATAGWAGGYTLELSSAQYAEQLFWANIQYIFICAMPLVMISFALIYSGRGALLSRRALAWLLIEPALTVALAFGSGALPLLRTGGTPVTVDGYILVAWHYGPFFWLHTLYSYGLMLAATVLLVPVILRSASLFRLQTVTVLVGILAPWIANAIYILDLSPYPYLDLTPFAFFLYAVAIGWGLLRLQFLDVVPVARDSVVEGLQEGVIVLGMKGLIADVNPAAARIFGHASGELIGRDPAQLHAALAGGLTTTGPAEVVLPGEAGPRAYELRRSAVRDHRDRERGQLLVLQDVTDRRLAEEERVRSQRLRAAGELAAGVAHNLNNILVGILAPARRLQDHTEEAVRLEAGTIAGAAERARDLVQRLHRGPRATQEGLEAVDVGRAIADAVEASRPRWQDEPRLRGVTIDVHAELDSPRPARADRSELHDALLNLVFNAVDAMPEGGTIRITAGERDGDVEISVTDDGVGMDPDTCSRVFEPFFTTKVDVGTGLGLATLYRDVQRWGGSVDVDSEPGGGSTFRLRLAPWTEPEAPWTDSEASAMPPATAATATPAPAPGADEPARVLIAEDETIVALLLGDCARELGHHVESVDNGSAAVERLRRGGIDVAVLDLGLPGQPGDEVALLGREMDPSLVLVLMTGWSLIPDDPRRAPFDLAMQKPFDPHQIVAILRQAVALRAQRRREA